jgi:hypothetical protein
MGAMDAMNNLPMASLIGGPLMAAIEADCAAGLKSFEFLQKNLLDTDKDGKSTARMIEFVLNQPVQQQDGTVQNEITTISAPLAVLATPGTIRVDTVDIEFNMEVKATTIDKSTTEASASFSGSAGFAWWKVSIQGSVSTKNESTRSTDTSAKYSVKVHAKAQPFPEGMARLMDFFTASVGLKSRQKAAA